ncbi:MAG: hypothetical protein QMD88_08740 [Coprothermobacterota bacterium]|nr:hypothetical protein [Coprothermobacterota bacterium]
MASRYTIKLIPRTPKNQWDGGSLTPFYILPQRTARPYLQLSMPVITPILTRSLDSIP